MPMRLSVLFQLLAALFQGPPLGSSPAFAEFKRDVQPTLQTFCYDCHGDGEKKGEVAFDDPGSNRQSVGTPGVWWKALKNLRAGLMPPQNKPQPSQSDKNKLEEWIKRRVFEIDAKTPTPVA